MSNRCYFCTKQFNETDVLKHDEHIIQNAIGGKLLSNDILCLSCGGKLGKLIDEEFSKSLSFFNTLIPLSRDRGKNDSQWLPIKGDIGNQTSVELRIDNDFKIQPLKPIYLLDETAKCIDVFGPTIKVAKAYSKSPDIKKYIGLGYSIRNESDDVAEFVANKISSVDLNSSAINNGITKIAIEFAVKCGAQFNMSPFRNFTESASLNPYTITNYIPNANYEIVFEARRLETKADYPIHSLILFSNHKKLYCFVELFGVIQKYITLDEEYSGPDIMASYYQRCVKEEFDETPFRACDWKDIMILSEQFGVNYVNRPFEEIQKDILQKARSKAYSIDEPEFLKCVRDLFELFTVAHLTKSDSFSIFDNLIKRGEDAKTWNVPLLTERTIR